MGVGGAAKAFIGDFNGDQINDVAALGYPSGHGSLVVWIEDDGGWDDPEVNPGDGFLNDVALSGASGTNLGGVAVVQSPAEVEEWTNPGTGALQLQEVVPDGGPDDFYGVAAGDLNNDGLEDIVATSASLTGVVILLNQGDGGYEGQFLDDGLGSVVEKVVLGNLNGDGLLDFAASTPGGFTLVALNQGGGSFAFQLVRVDGDTFDIALSDLTGNGRLDVVLAEFVPTGVQVLENLGDGGFDKHTLIPLGSRVESVTSADFNGDGLRDIAVGYGGSSDAGISILENQGKYRFALSVPFVPGLGLQPTITSLVAGPTTPGAGTDLVAADNGDSSVYIFPNCTGLTAPCASSHGVCSDGTACCNGAACHGGLCP